MRFALVGIDPQALELARAVTSSPRHQLVRAVDLGEAVDAIRRLAPTAHFEPSWEALLVDESIDAIIVASSGDEDAAADRLRKLVQAGRALLVSHPVHPSMLVCYELDMIRRDSRALILPFAPMRWHPAVQRLDALFGAGQNTECGQLEQVVIERRLADRSPDSVRAHFARDVDLARLLAGELTRLSAMAPSSDATGYANLGIQLSGPANVLVRYSVLPVEREAEARLTAVGSEGKAVLNMPEASDWTLELAGGSHPPERFPDGNGAAAAIEQLTKLIAGAEVQPTWVDACREIELADSIQRSLDKGRTVELHYEDYSETGTFKGTMTSLGCALLWFAPLVLVAGIALGQLGLGIANYVPHLLLAVLVLFLLLQALQFVVPTRPD